MLGKEDPYQTLNRPPKPTDGPVIKTLLKEYESQTCFKIPRLTTQPEDIQIEPFSFVNSNLDMIEQQERIHPPTFTRCFDAQRVKECLGNNAQDDDELSKGTLISC